MDELVFVMKVLIVLEYVVLKVWKFFWILLVLVVLMILCLVSWDKVFMKVLLMLRGRMLGLNSCLFLLLWMLLMVWWLESLNVCVLEVLFFVVCENRFESSIVELDFCGVIVFRWFGKFRLRFLGVGDYIIWVLIVCDRVVLLIDLLVVIVFLLSRKVLNLKFVFLF